MVEESRNALSLWTTFAPQGVCDKTETKYNIQITAAQHKFKRLHK